MTPTDPPPTDDQLDDMVRFIARTCLEVERGLRPPGQLTRFLDPATAHSWRRANPIGRFDAGPVLRRDIAHPQITHVNDDLVRASVTTRTDRRRWGALTFELRRDGARWTVANLQRLLAATRYRTGGDITLEIPLEHRIRSAIDERTLVDAALNATNRRLTDLSKSDPAWQPTKQMARSWEHIRGDLDHELADLKTKLDLRQTITKPPRG